MDMEQKIAEFLARKGVITRCPTACVGRTQAQPSAEDRKALAEIAAKREADREAKRLRRFN